MTRRYTYVLLAICLMLSALVADCAWAYPRLAVSGGTGCRSCHINPSGGGPRNEYGSREVALNRLTLPLGRHLMASHLPTDTSEQTLLVGVDVSQSVDKRGDITREQTDAHLTVRPLDKLAYTVRVCDTGIIENYALLNYDTCGHLAFKAGRFYPTFGLHQSDYSAFCRTATGLTRQAYADGASLTTEWYGTALTVEGFSVDSRNILGLHLAADGRIGGIGWLLGVSLRQTETVDSSSGQYPCARAAFGGLSAYGFTALGELDMIGRDNDTLALFASLQSQIVRGAVVELDYDFLDADRSMASGVEERLSLALELYPIPYVRLRPTYRYYTDGVLRDEDEFALQVHFGF